MQAERTDQIERRADRYSWALVLGFIGLSFLIEGTTGHMEFIRHGPQDASGLAGQWLYEFSSHIVLIGVAAIVPLWLDYFPLSLSTWKRRIPHYALAFLIFTVLHILLMVAIRHAVWPFIAEGRYEFGLLRLEPWAYEIRKDVFTFLSLLGVFMASRHIAAMDEERLAAREDAQSTGQLTLKSGGRQILIPADQVIYASAAGNYVELYLTEGRHFVRLTLSELNKLLTEAGAQPVRLHRSHLTVRPHLREIGPAEAVLSTGTRLPIGRSYRQLLSAA